LLDRDRASMQALLQNQVVRRGTGLAWSTPNDEEDERVRDPSAAITLSSVLVKQCSTCTKNGTRIATQGIRCACLALALALGLLVSPVRAEEESPGESRAEMSSASEAPPAVPPTLEKAPSAASLAPELPAVRRSAAPPRPEGRELGGHGRLRLRPTWTTWVMLGFAGVTVIATVVGLWLAGKPYWP
jgi:hypothetical protein